MACRFSWLILFTIAPLYACAPPSFEVVPCDVGGKMGFRIAPIEGWFSDYEPRPTSISVRTTDRQSYERDTVWETELPYNGLENDGFPARPVREFIVYGQKMSGWEIQQTPKSLTNGQMYLVIVSDGSHSGSAEFKIDKPLSAC